jgi:S1-C subfamily serine protease
VKANFHLRQLSRSIFLALATSVWTANSTVAMEVDIPGVVRQAKPAVVQIIALDQQNKPLKTGTGFFISADGNLLTNYHVISGASSILAKTPSGAIYFLKEIGSVSPETDVALLRFYATDVPHLNLGSTTTAVEGQRVLVIGNPEGLEGTVSDGIISAFRDNRSMIQISAPVSHGSSGSPVLDESGQVLGIATLVSQEGQNLNFAISAEAVRVAVFSATTEDGVSGKTAAAEPAITLNHSPNESKGSALIFKIDNALGEHDWITLSTYVGSGVVNYFGHRNASATFIRKDMESDAKTYRWTRTYPDRSTFRRFVKDGVVHESVEERTEALEYSGRHHQAYCLFEIAYEDRDPPSILAFSLKVLK